MPACQIQPGLVVDSCTLYPLQRNLSRFPQIFPYILDKSTVKGYNEDTYSAAVCLYGKLLLKGNLFSYELLDMR